MSIRAIIGPVQCKTKSNEMNDLFILVRSQNISILQPRFFSRLVALRCVPVLYLNAFFIAN